jgi:hypothetical protein
MEKMEMKTKMIAAALLVSVLAALYAHAGEQRDFPTTRFYTKDGSSAGSATTYSGGVTKFYSKDGRLMGTAIKQGNKR